MLVLRVVSDRDTHAFSKLQLRPQFEYIDGVPHAIDSIRHKLQPSLLAQETNTLPCLKIVDILLS
jgi:hypothetical protein